MNMYKNFLFGAILISINLSPNLSSAFNIDPKASQPLHVIQSPTPGSCQIKMSHGYPIPDPTCTPGAINPTVTQEVLQDPAFRTKLVRQSVTTEKQKESTYALYGIPHPASNTGQNQTCELDHLVSIELGGADTLDNIWPQCGLDNVPVGQRYFKQKDKVEDYLASMVRKGKMNLSEVQKGISEDWTQYIEAANVKAEKKGKHE